MTTEEIKKLLIEQGVYDMMMDDYNATHTNGIPNTAIQSRFQEMLTKYNIEHGMTDELFG